MANKYQRFFPGTFELIGLFFVTVLVVLVGNSRQLLDYYGLSASNRVLKQGAGDAITTGLSKLDNLSFTNEVVTFLIWAFVGLFCFSLAQAVIRGYQEFQNQEELSSNRYVHPSTFVRAAFWRSVALNFVVWLVGVTALIILLFAFFAYVLPVGLDYTQIFLQGISLTHLGYFLLGLAVTYIGLLVLDLCLRFLAQRQQLLA